VDDAFDQRAANEQAQGQESEGDVMASPLSAKVGRAQSVRGIRTCTKAGTRKWAFELSMRGRGNCRGINGLTFRGFAG
jgi:hypothetical protein